MTSSTLTLYKLANFSFDAKDALPAKDTSLQSFAQRLEDEFVLNGMRRSVEAVLLVHDHGHPHVLLLRNTAPVNGLPTFTLPGDQLQPDEDEVSGLRRILNVQLAPNSNKDDATAAETTIDWKIGECIASWYRPNPEVALYPYLPVHITRPREFRQTFVVSLPSQLKLGIPSNYQPVAVPLYELYDGEAKYGQQLASLPVALSRLQLVCAK
ncbi:hypothetical protein GQ42DRAFT_169990 [Ramicandelaber brevisporus]|nr:hypothetical protein GQ42DRAFT_169990 [Ramicandelaber brevisporus]